MLYHEQKQLKINLSNMNKNHWAVISVSQSVLKKVYIAFVLLCMVISGHAQSQYNNVLVLQGRIKDFVTHVDVPGSKIEVLNASDSAVIASAEALNEYQSGEDKWVTAEYWMGIPRKEGNYILRVSYDGYATAYVDLPLLHLYKRETRRDLGTIFLKRPKTLNLEEVVVKTTKVKFYHKGDTIVYNADAFQLGEGSMLDALVRQLPGAELGKDGRIYVNG